MGFELHALRKGKQEENGPFAPRVYSTKSILQVSDHVPCDVQEAAGDRGYFDTQSSGVPCSKIELLSFPAAGNALKS